MKKTLIFENTEEAGQIVPLLKIKKLSIHNQTYCITQTAEGFVIFDQQCPHSGHDLSGGAINVHNEVVCPSHAYRFNLKTGESNRPCAGLKTYACFIEEGKIYAQF